MNILSTIDLDGLFSSHWHVVLLVAAVFFLIQISLCLRFATRMRRDERALADLLFDLDRGGTGRNPRRGFPWLGWVLRIFPDDATTPGNYSRDDVLKELDTHISARWDYLMLQRLGVMAPLLGVILTVMGFWWLTDLDGGDKSLEELIQAVSPLVVGVGAGAVLAAVNQLLLHFAGIRAEGLRLAARTWFDLAIWREVGLDTQAATIKAIASIEKMAKSLSDAADQHQETSQWLSESTLAIQESATEFHDVVQGMNHKLGGLPHSLVDLHGAMEASGETFKALIPVAERVVAGLDVSISAFRASIDSQFLEASRLQRLAMGDLINKVNQHGGNNEPRQLTSPPPADEPSQTARSSTIHSDGGR